MRRGTAHPELFAPERSSRAESIDEALALCATDFRYTRHQIPAAQVFLDDDLALHFGGDRYALTEKAFDDLCNLVGVPLTFAKGIPTDLVSIIVERLKTFQPQLIVPIARDHTVVGIVNPRKWTHSRAQAHRAEFRPVSNATILRLLEKLRGAFGGPPRILLADSGLAVELLHPALTLEPKVGDITRVGLAITSSETGGPMPVARGYTLRLVCANGATVPARLGLLRFDTDWRVSLERRLAAFQEGLQGFALDVGRLEAAYARLVAESISDQFFYNLCRQVRYLYRHDPNGERLADAALGVASEARQQIVGQVRRRQAELRSAGGARPEPPHTTGLQPWDIFNHITAAAREETYRRRLALEHLASDVLAAFTPPNPSGAPGGDRWADHPRVRDESPEPFPVQFGPIRDSGRASTLEALDRVLPPVTIADVALGIGAPAAGPERAARRRPPARRLEPSPWVRKGSVWVRETYSTALLCPQAPTSFLADFHLSVSPLAGCALACGDCSEPALPNVKFRHDRLPDSQPTNTAAAWGSWVEVRVRAVEVLRRAIDQGKLDGARLMMSPLSDVYWPGERDYRLTRGILEALAERPVFDWLVISTRSDLVLRDLDVLQQLGDKVEVGISIPTDREDVKAIFGRRNPSLARRFAAAHQLMNAGVPTRIHVAPLQPHSSAFAARLSEAAHWVWIDFHSHFGAGFAPRYAAHGLAYSTPADAMAFADELRRYMGAARVRVGQAHFADRWAAMREEVARPAR